MLCAPGFSGSTQMCSLQVGVTPGGLDFIKDSFPEGCYSRVQLVPADSG